MPNIERCGCGKPLTEVERAIGPIITERDLWRSRAEVGKERIAFLERQHRGAVEALRRIAAGHSHPAKMAGEALDAMPPSGDVYDPPYLERGR